MPHDFERRLRETIRARHPQRIQVPGARAAAVLVPVVGQPEPTLVLTLRTETLSSHRGQVSFPGGSLDAPDEPPETAALREAREELGLDPAMVRVLGELDSIETFVSGYVVTPIVGWIERAPPLRPNPAEVARVLHVPVARLTQEIHRGPGFSHDGRTYPTEAWVHAGDVIWGVTARILRLFLARLAEAGIAEAPGEAAWAPPERSRSTT
ncbi:CoA pyrophosphatase [soil metagenome]